MAEVAGPSVDTPLENNPPQSESNDTCEPEAKKRKLEGVLHGKEYKLEDRLNGILCCTVCLDLPNSAVYQCSNGHLMCAGCLSHLLADARLKDETATCPNCRCEISKALCIRNLAVEKAVSELPSDCQFCSKQLPRNELERHESELCQERLVTCKYERIGCPWRGPFHELQVHEESCSHPHKTGLQVMEALSVSDQKYNLEMNLYKSIFELLSLEKVTFSDLQLRPYRTDDFITKLFYETSRFSAFNCQWVLKAHVNNHTKNPQQSCRRVLSYQLVLKSKIQNSIKLHYLALKGPNGDMTVAPCIYQFEFSNDNTETDYQELNIDDNECNKLLAAKAINMRLILFQVTQ